jgi:5-methylcytosine-specific restriction protein A
MNYHEKYNAFYQSRDWRALRAAKFVQANGVCERCLKNGIVRVGREVHHIVPIDKDWSKRLDINNLVCLCSDCHNSEHSRESPLQQFNKFWEELDAKSTVSNS